MNDENRFNLMREKTVGAKHSFRGTFMASLRSTNALPCSLVIDLQPKLDLARIIRLASIKPRNTIVEDRTILVSTRPQAENRRG